jgi:hypothetical protein
VKLEMEDADNTQLTGPNMHSNHNLILGLQNTTREEIKSCYVGSQNNTANDKDLNKSKNRFNATSPLRLIPALGVSSGSTFA